MREDQVPAVATGLSIVYNLVAPIVLIKGEGTPLLHAEVIGFDDDALHLLVTNRGAFPFVGGITATTSQDGEQVALGRAETAIYTRRRVEIPISALPESGHVLLQFDKTYGSMTLEVSSRLTVPVPIEIEL